MEFRVSYNGTTYTLNPEQILLDERLDEALDSMKFSFISKDITTDLPPFTILTAGTEKYYCSSECDEVVEMPGYYYHTVTAIEPTKILEAFIIGSKAFSVVDGKASYNTGFDRIYIISELINNKYGYYLSLPGTLSTKFTDERSYSFGAGTTAFDMISEIMKVQGCLPRLTDITSSGAKLTYVDIDALETDTITTLTKIIKVTKTQSVDDYCSDIETEMSEVVDRDTETTVLATARSTEDYIIKDNACVLLPSNCESVSKVYIDVIGITGPTFRVPVGDYDTSYFNFGSLYANYDGEGLVSKATLLKICSGVSTIVSNFINWIQNRDSKTYNYAIVQHVKDVCIYCTLLESSSTATSKDWICFGILDKANWDLLATKEQPGFIYYDSGSNTINGFNNYKDSTFWNKVIYGEGGPFLKDQFRLGTDSLYYRTGLHPLIYDDWSSRANYSTFSGISFITDFHLHYGGTDISYVDANILDHMFKITYIAKPTLKATQSKSITPENETSWKKTTRSYNNGANTVDFNQLIPAMKRNADMLGLETKTVESLDDSVGVGGRTQYGYVISKQTTFHLLDGEKVVDDIFYNCCQNYQQIAAAIGVATQYEATNVPNTDIITRHIIIENSVDSYLFSTLKNSTSPFYLWLRPGGVKCCSKVCANGVIYFICEADDNYGLGNALSSTETDNYYANKPVEYSDDDQCRIYYEVSLIQGDMINDNSWVNLDNLKGFPNGYVFGNNRFEEEVDVYKDARERLVFEFRVTIND